MSCVQHSSPTAGQRDAGQHDADRGGPTTAPRQRGWLPMHLAVAAALALAMPGESVRAAPLPGPSAAAVSHGPDRWERELERRTQLLRTHKGRAPEAILGLLGLLGQVHGDIDPARLDAVLVQVAQASSRHPLVRSFARYVQARVSESRGDIGAAQQRLSAEGYVLSWQIVGPFDNAGRSGETRVYAPETEPFASEQTFEGKLPAESLPWRAWDYQDAPRGGYVSLDDRLRPNTAVTGYATAWVHVPNDTAAAVHLGSGGPYEIWVEGAAVGGADSYRLVHPLQETFAVALHKGWNRVLVKVSAQDGMWGFYLRFSQADGAPLDALRMSASQPDGWSSPQVSASSASHRVASLREQLEAKYPAVQQAHGAKKKRPTRTQINQAKRYGAKLVEFYRYTHPFDSDDASGSDLARAVAELVPSPRAAWMSAVMDRDASRSLSALYRGIALAQTRGKPNERALLGRMLLEAAWRERASGLEDRYAARLAEALKAAPFDPIVELALIERATEQGLVWWSLKWVQTLAKRHPHSHTLRAELASRLRSQGRTKQALAVLQGPAQSQKLRLSSQIDMLLELGRPDAATELARRRAADTPGIPDVHVTVARLEEARGAGMAARAAWAKALSLAPADARLHGELGRVLVRAGEPSAAATSLRRSLQLRPQQPLLRDLLAELDQSAPDDLFARYHADFDKISVQATPASWAGKGAGMLRHRIAVKVLPNGLTERLEQRIIRIVDDRGARSEMVQALGYDPAEAVVEVRRARIRSKDGTIREVGRIEHREIASAGYRMYYAQRQVQVIFSGLEPGDTLEVAFLRRDVAARNMFDTYFGDMVALQGVMPRKRVEYILEAPQDKPIYFNLKGIKRKTSKDGKFVRYRFTNDDVAAVKSEGAMPGWTEVADYLHASTYKDWNDVGNWYWDLVRDQLAVDDSVRAAVREAVDTLPPDATQMQKVEAIYTWVVRKTHYVGLEFGIHGFKPYRTTEVIARRFGDCKDKASLLKVMLAEIDIPSHLVLVRTRDQGKVLANPPSLAVFNHAITYVPELDLYLDGTAEWSGANELPAGDQGATVLIIKDGKGAKFGRIPVTPAEHNQRKIEETVALNPSGSATVQHTFTVRGTEASQLRVRLASQERRSERLSQIFGGQFPGARVYDVSAPDIEDIRVPVALRTKFDVPQWATGQGDALRFRVLGRSSNLASSLTSAPTREHDLVLNAARHDLHTLHYTLPRGHRFSRVPDPVQLKSPLGQFSLELKRTATGIDVRSELKLSNYRITPEQYPEFRKFLRRIDASLEQDFEIVPDK